MTSPILKLLSSKLPQDILNYCLRDFLMISERECQYNRFILQKQLKNCQSFCRQNEFMLRMQEIGNGSLDYDLSFSPSACVRLMPDYRKKVNDFNDIPPYWAVDHWDKNGIAYRPYPRPRAQPIPSKPVQRKKKGPRAKKRSKKH